MTAIHTRSFDPALVARLAASGIVGPLARVYAARGVTDAVDLDTDFKRLLPPAQLAHVEAAARFLADAIAVKKRLMIVADYDCDGATACAVGVKALTAMGAAVSYIVPNRFEYGYGLTPEIVQLAAQHKPDVLITVDNGIASIEGVRTANALGMQVLITDHHLPGDSLPDATCIVNPNQPGDAFASKHLAGVGVIFYVMLALRAELRSRGAFAAGFEPNLAALLDLVAVGTVADVVRLDGNNRILVTQGLRRIRAGQACVGIDALMQVAGRDVGRASTYDLGFVIGPRINAAGRLTDMSAGIECLLATDAGHALRLASELDKLNRERREIEADMQTGALESLENTAVQDQFSVVMFNPEWHAGVVGILASRLKDRYHRPALCFAPDASGALKGSGRSIAALHLRDALDLVTKRHPELIDKFGGHAAAAGLTVQPRHFDAFCAAFERVCRDALTDDDLQRVIETDGSLDRDQLALPLATTIEQQVWGQGFAEPRFVGSFRVLGQRVLKEQHVRATVDIGGQRFTALRWGDPTPLPATLEAVYRVGVNRFRGTESIDLTFEHIG